MKVAVTGCLPKKYADPPGGCVRVYVASLKANLGFVDVAGDSVSD